MPPPPDAPGAPDDLRQRREVIVLANPRAGSQSRLRHVHELALAPDLNMLAAGTHGRGVWEIALTNYLTVGGPVNMSRQTGNQNVLGIAMQSKQELFGLNQSNFAGTQDPPAQAA